MAESFRSPLSKLLRFFQSSRNKWKEKCLQAKGERKRLKQRVGKLEASRDHWKEKCRQLQAERKEQMAAAAQKT